MATAATSATEQRDTKEQSGKSQTQIVVVDLGEPQSSAAVSRLRKGKGKLLTKVEKIVKDLMDDGTVKSNAQPVVIVVSEYPVPPWLKDDDDD
jgi:hypothetical protein